MYRRLIIVSVIIFAGLCGFCALGYHSIRLHAGSLAASRAREFMAVAEQIRLDVKRKFDEFIAAEQNRPYTDYQYFYVPFAENDASALVRSPLADNVANGLAYGYFQIDADGAIVSPYNRRHEIPDDPEIVVYFANVNDKVLTALAGSGPKIRPEIVEEIAMNQQLARSQDVSSTFNLNFKKRESSAQESKTAQLKEQAAANTRRGQYPIESLEKQASQVITQNRANVGRNFDENVANDPQRQFDSELSQERDLPAQQMPSPTQSQTEMYGTQLRAARAKQSPGPVALPPPPQQTAAGREAGRRTDAPLASRASQPLVIEKHDTSGRNRKDHTEALTLSPPSNELAHAETIQIRIEPFRPIRVPGGCDGGVIDGQVFLLRHVQIEQQHFIQGFRLNEKELVNQVAESAARHVVRRDINFDVGRAESPAAAHTAILDFGFGDLVLNLFELKPRLIADQVRSLKTGFFAVVGLVFLAVTLAQVSLWRTACAHIRLARKKDDFISAVSHELRTPLTTIRMHTEMLEKGWIKNEAKRSEYYGAMRQETERLTRLVENVLDFSRIQRGRKKYRFKLGDVNASITEVLDMMTPCAAQAGFDIQRDLAPVAPFAFDADAVMQIVINLLDNALKYARTSKEKMITVRTRSENGYAIIEVEDHGPGIPRLQRKKIFEEFYRCGNESRRETTGTGLGLALVKRFAQAHDGFVEVLNARPTGAIFRVALTASRT